MPSEPPEVNVTSPNSTSLKVNWLPINGRFLHGIHKGYCLYQDDTLVVSLNDTGKQEKILVQLAAYTKYYIQVAAKTNPGCGAKSPKLAFYTLEDSKLILYLLLLP